MSRTSPEQELDTLRQYFEELAELAEKDKSMTESHSLEEAERRHAAKAKG